MDEIELREAPLRGPACLDRSISEHCHRTTASIAERRLTRTRRSSILKIGAPRTLPRNQGSITMALLELGVLLGVLGWIAYLLRTAPPDPKSRE